MKLTNLQHLINSIEREEINKLSFNLTSIGSPIKEGYIVSNIANNQSYEILINDDEEIISCSCPHHYYRGVICKHMIHAAIEKELSINGLSKKPARFKLDELINSDYGITDLSNKVKEIIDYDNDEVIINKINYIKNDINERDNFYYILKYIGKKRCNKLKELNLINNDDIE